MFARVGPSGFYKDDTICGLGPDGRVLEERSVIDILLQSGWAALPLEPVIGKQFTDEDPLHVNDVEVLSPELAPAFPMFAAGDLMISARHVNTIFVADPHPAGEMGDHCTFLAAASIPDFQPDGHIMVYDNRRTGDTPRLLGTLVYSRSTRQHVAAF